jgi:NAD(P)-dependent dehydrogenase (short-subunit alcohol dehydrogenase family)
MGKLDGKVALISGTGRGMGRAAALEFAAQGSLDDHTTLRIPACRAPANTL